MTLIPNGQWGSPAAGTIDDTTDVQSSLANTVVLQQGLTTQTIVSLRAPANRPRHWRITLQRLQRADGNAPIVDGGAPGNTLQFPTQTYSYAAGFQQTPAWPPARSNPVLVGFRQVQVQVHWGVGNALPAKLAADWPMMGGSIVVWGTSIDVFAQGNVPADSIVDVPKATATIAPHAGVLSPDDGELSFTQTIPVLAQDAGPPATWGGVAYVPDFARRVRAVLGSTQIGFVGDPVTVPITGDPPTVLTWFADNQRVLDSAFQGLITQAVLPGPVVVGAFAPVAWHPVPAGATLLNIHGATDFEGFAQLHWRIAP